MFVGRERELERFAHELERVRCALIYGVGGIGKTAFALSACEALAARQSARLAYHSCRPGDGPTSIFASVLEQLSADGGDPTLAPGKPLERLLEWSRSGSAVICIDDLHRTESEAVLHAVVHLANRTRSLWLCLAARELLPLSPVALDHLVLRLGGLDSSASERLWAELASLYGGSREPGERDLHGGTPLLIKQAFSSAGAPGLADPFGIDALEGDEAALLAELAAYRLPVPQTALAAAASDAPTTLARLERRFLIEPADVKADRLLLHDVVREAVLQSRHAPTRETHARCLAFWRTRLSDEPGSDRIETEIVHHATEAQADDVLLAILERESREVRRVPPASTLFDRELSSALDRLEQRRALTLDLVLLRARLRARQGAVLEAYRAIEQLDASGPMLDLVRGELAYMLGRFDDATPRLERVAADVELPAPLRGFAFALAKDAERQCGRPRQALAALEAASEIFEPLGPVGAGIRAWMSAVTFMDSERYDRALEALDRARRELGVVAHMVSDFALLESMARSAAAYLGRFEGGGAEPVELFDENVFFRVVARLLHAQELFVHGDVRAALSQAERARDTSRVLGAVGLELWALWVWADAAHVLGLHRQIVAAIEPKLGQPPWAEHARPMLRVRAALARALSRLGRSQASQRVARELLAEIDSLPGTQARVRALLGETEDESKQTAVGYDALERDVAQRELALARDDAAVSAIVPAARALVERTAQHGFDWLRARALAVLAEAAVRCARFDEAEVATGELESIGVERGYAAELEAAEALRRALDRSRDGGAPQTASEPLSRRLRLAEPLSLELRTAAGIRYAHAADAAHFDWASFAFAIDFSRGWVWQSGAEISLARRATLLATLRALAAAPGELVSTADLGSRVLGDAYHPLRHHSRLAMNVARLRQLIGAELVEGTRDGYRLVLPAGWLIVSAVRTTSDSHA